VLLGYLRGRHEDLNTPGQRPMSDKSLMRLYRYFDSIGDDARMEVIFNEQGTREMSDSVDEANEDRHDLFDILKEKKIVIDINDPLLVGEPAIQEKKRLGIFSPDGRPLDYVRSILQDYGFKYATPAELVDGIKRRLATGEELAVLTN